MTRRLLGRLFLCSALFGLLPAAAEASVNARSVGMAGAYGAIASDADAMTWNPGHLGLSGPRDRFAMTLLPNLSLGLGNNVFSFGELARLLSSEQISQEDVSGVLAEIPPSGWRFLLDTGTSFAVAMPGARVGAFAHAAVDAKEIDVPRDMMAFMLEGNAAHPSVKIDTMQGATATAVASLGSSFGFPLGPNTGMGMNLRYLRGLAYAQVTEASGSLLTVTDDGFFAANAELAGEYSTNGNGIAADFGVAGSLNDSVRWGAVLGNIGVITWNQIREQRYALDVAPFSIVDASGSVTDFGAVTRDAVKQSSRNLGSREIWLPPYLRLSGALYPWKPLTLTADLQVGFGDGYGVSRVPELKVGSEFRLFEWLPLRGGISVGGDRDLLLATGVGIDMPLFRLDFAMGAINGFGGHAKGAYYALSNTMHF